MNLRGEDEPEDAWDRNDPPHLLVLNLRQRLALLLVVDARSQHRLAQLLDDLDWLRQRLQEGDG